MCEFRKLKANELQCRVTDTKYKGSATILIYKDARVDMRILDETVGSMNWIKEYKSLDGKIYCGVGIWNENTNQFVYKWDCGSDNNNGIEAEKSEASDAFKRACVNFGIGRELYDIPRIKIKCPDNYYYNEKLCMSFSVKEIIWNNNNLESLIIVDKFGNVVYNFNEKDSNSIKNNSNNNDVINNKKDNLIQFCKEAKATITDDKMKNELNNFYKYYSTKIDNWKGNFNLNQLWVNWQNKINF